MKCLDNGIKIQMSSTDLPCVIWH